MNFCDEDNDVAMAESAFANDTVMVHGEIVRKLGTGCSAEVFELLVNHNKMRYALKAFHNSSTGIRCFQNERYMLSHLKNHPNVVQILSWYFDEEKKSYCTVMELADTTLMDFTLSLPQQRMPESLARCVITSLLEVVSSLHARNIVHRDLKPDNIVLQSVGSDKNENESESEQQSSILKLIDFGDAIVCEDEVLYKELKGTSYYLSPERWREHYGWELKASEVWAIGIIAFELLTGFRLFYHSDTKKLRSAILCGKYMFPKDIPLSFDAKHFISSCLTYHAKCRPRAGILLTHPWIVGGKATMLKVQVPTPNDSTPVAMASVATSTTTPTCSTSGNPHSYSRSQ